MLERFKVPDADRVYVPSARVRTAAESVFLAMGLSDANARQAADVLVTNDLRGVETHGVSNMLRSYVAGYRSGELNPNPAVETERESGTTAILNANAGLGVHVAPLAMRMAIDKAATMGVASVNVHNVGHMGGAGYHAMMAAEADMIGLAMSTSGGVRMLPTFGARPMLGTNPIAWAAPAGDMPPFLFDIGTTQIAGNKATLAKRVGAKMLPGWIAAPDGAPIMEEVDLPETYWMLPFGGTREQGSHKGYGFASDDRNNGEHLDRNRAQFHSPRLMFSPCRVEYRRVYGRDQIQIGYGHRPGGSQRHKAGARSRPRSIPRLVRGGGDRPAKPERDSVPRRGCRLVHKHPRRT